jgi:hypothetical protein
LFAQALELSEIKELIGAGIRRITKEAAAELRIVRQKQHSEGRKPPPNDLYTLLFRDLEVCGE